MLVPGIVISRTGHRDHLEVGAKATLGWGWLLVEVAFFLAA